MQRCIRSFVLVLPLSCLAVAAELKAQDADFYLDQGEAWTAKGEYDRAIADFTQALKLDPNLAEAYIGRGDAWNYKDEYDKAIADFDQALKLDPNLAEAYSGRGESWNDKGEYDKAIADFDQALRLNPNLADAYCGRGAAYYEKDEYDKAIADCNQALRLNPNLAEAYRVRGECWNEKGEYAKTIADYTQAQRLSPNDARISNCLAYLQATCPDAHYRDGQAAYQNANKAYQLSGGKDWDVIDTLAAAYAECGDFEKARQWETKAIDLAQSSKPPAAKEDIDEAAARLELYKQGRPRREELKKR